jgi:hypothetical protein
MQPRYGWSPNGNSAPAALTEVVTVALKSLSRAQLDDKAVELGIESPGNLGTKALVVLAIEEAEGGAVSPDLFKSGARVVSVFGPFNSRAIIEVSADLAQHLFREPLPEAGRTGVIDAVAHDVKEIRERDEGLAESAHAATAVRLAYELEHPFNSATSKAACAKTLNETMDRLRELAPEQPKKDRVDEIGAKRAKRRGKAATSS